jgi:serine/threonine-protein kinase
VSKAPDIIGRYKIQGRIGQGGMGVLFLAHDPMLDRQLAIKLLRDDNEELRERFSREARSVARLRHPNIVTIFDVGEQDGQPFIAMEYIQGQTLADIIRGGGSIDIPRKLQIIDELCDGLAFAHKLGIVHRDVKPANVMVENTGEVKILDFGIARIAESGMTQAGMLIGTLNYMSPEQVAGQVVDGRSDIFAVGAVLYEFLTYRQAFPGGLQNGILNRILNDQPPALESIVPNIDAEVVSIVGRALQKSPDARYQDLAAMRRDLQRTRQRLEQDAPETIAIGPVDTGETVEIEAPTEPVKRTPTPRWGTDRDALAKRRAAQIAMHLEAATKAMEAQNFEDAVAAAEQALLLNAEEPSAIQILERARHALDERQLKELLAKSRELLDQGLPTQALSVVEQAVTLAPGSSAVRKLQQAIEEARAERERKRQRDEAIAAAIARAQAAFDSGDFGAADRAAGEALALAPDHAEGRALQSRARAEIERLEREREAARRRDELIATAIERAGSTANHEAAIKALNEALALDPGRTDIRALVDTRQAALDAEREEARRIRERDEKISGAIAKAAETGSHEAAIAILNDALALDSSRTDVRGLIGQRQSALEAERAEARRRQEIDEKVTSALESARRAMSHQDAVAILDEASRLDPARADVRKALAERQAALKREQEEVRIAKERADAIDGAITKAGKTTSHAEAIQVLEGAAALDPAHAEVKARLAERRAALQREQEEARRIRDRDEKIAGAVAKAGKTGHAAALAILNEALALDSSRTDVRALIAERQSALEAEREEVRRRREIEQAIAAALAKAGKTAAHKDAIAILEGASTQDPSHAGLQRALADRRAALEKDETEARRAKERAEKVAAAIARASKAASHAAAIDSLKEALSVDPAHAEAQRLLTERQRAFEQEQEEARRVRERRERVAGAIAGARAESSHQKAIAILEAAIEKDPDQDELARALASRQRALEDEARQIRERQEKTSAALARAKAASSHEEAVSIIEKALKDDPDHQDLRQLLLTRQAALEREREEARRARERQERVAAAIAKVKSTASHEAAVGILEGARELDPDSTEIKQLLASRQAALDAEREAQRVAREREAKIGSLVKQAKAAKAHTEAITYLAQVLALDSTHREARGLLDRHEAALKAEQAEAARLEAIDNARQTVTAFIDKDDLEAAAKALTRAESELDAKKALKDLRKRLQDAEKVKRQQTAKAAAVAAPQTLASGEGAAPPSRSPMMMGGIAAVAIVAFAGWMMTRSGSTPPSTASEPSAAPPSSANAPAQPNATEPGAKPPDTNPPAPSPSGAPPVSPTTESRPPAAPEPALSAAEKQAAAALTLGRQQLSRGELVPAADTALGGLKAEPGNKDLLQLGSAIMTAARGQTADARRSATGRDGARGSAPFRSAEQRENEGARQARGGRYGLAVRSFTDATRLYAQAEQEAAARLAAAKPTAAAPPPEPSNKPTVPLSPVTETPAAPPPSPPAAATNPKSSPPPSSSTVNPPAPSPSTPATSPKPPATPKVNDEALIRDVIDSYAAAFSARDAAAVQRIFPNVPGNLAKGFQGYRELTMTIDQVRIAVNGAEATVNCVVRQAFRLEVGGMQRPQPTPTVFRLQKTNDRWLIVDRRP